MPGESECMFGGLVRRALVTELTVGEPDQQVSLYDRDVPWTGPCHIPIPVRRCPGAADHQDPVMTSYLPLTW